MNIWLILLAAQVTYIAAQIVLSVAASVRERGEDSRFAGDKVGFRS